MWTTDRVAGGVLALVGLVVLEETWRLGLPLGTLHNPGPGYTPVVLSLILLGFGAAVAALGGGAQGMRTVEWTEWRHAVAILGACAFAALALERIGFRLTMAVILAFLVGVVERKPLLLTAVFTAVFSLGAFFLFDTMLRVPLPRGPLGF